jgi:hypothetical protein
VKEAGGVADVAEVVLEVTVGDSGTTWVVAVDSSM